MIVVSDTSPVANLILINKLDILHILFGKIIIPPAVDKEIKALKNLNIDLDTYINSSWIALEKPVDTDKVSALMKMIDDGEAEAIVIAKELKADYLLIDERKGTRLAKHEGCSTIGLVGVLIKAKEKEIIGRVMPVLDELENVEGFWIGKDLKSFIQKLVNE